MNKHTENWREWVRVRLINLPRKHYKRMARLRLSHRGKFMKTPTLRWAMRNYPSVIDEFNRIKENLL